MTSGPAGPVMHPQLMQMRSDIDESMAVRHTGGWQGCCYHKISSPLYPIKPLSLCVSPTLTEGKIMNEPRPNIPSSHLCILCLYSRIAFFFGGGGDQNKLFDAVLGMYSSEDCRSWGSHTSHRMWI